MMKNSKNLLICVIVGFALLLVYLKLRYADLQKIQGELTTTVALRNDLVANDREVARLVRRYGAGADVPVFVEQMHRYSSQLGIAADYELRSSPQQSSGGHRGGAANQGAARTNLAVSRMQIALRGEYRDIAEYLRLLQVDKNPKRFIDLKVGQEKGVPVLNLNLELYSYRGGNGA